MAEFFAVAAVIGLLCGMVAASIAQSRGLQPGGYFLAGLFLGVIGIVIAALVQPPRPAMTPPGWYPDPWRQARMRWHDGYQWTPHVTQPPAP